MPFGILLVVYPMATIGVYLLRRCPCPLLSLLLPTGGLQTLGRLGRLNVLLVLLVKQPLGFVYFRREEIVMLLEFCHFLPKGSHLSQKLRFDRGLKYWSITERSARV
ncbi:unnamed protein product, partial [Prunus brigantina]